MFLFSASCANFPSACVEMCYRLYLFIKRELGVHQTFTQTTLYIYMESKENLPTVTLLSGFEPDTCETIVEVLDLFQA